MIKRLRKSVISLGIVLSLLMQMNIPVLATGGNGGETLLYFVDAGDQNVNTLSNGEGYGLYNSVTDRVFGRDAVSGKRWGVMIRKIRPERSMRHQNQAIPEP